MPEKKCTCISFLRMIYRTEKDENYSLLCDLPNDLLQKLLEENTKLLTMSESEKKISAVDTAD